MKLKELIHSFRVDADDLLRDYHWPDESLRIWFNEAENEACIRARLLRERVDPRLCKIAVRENASVYKLDKRVIEIVYASMVYSTSVGMLPYLLPITTAAELDQYRPFWRSFKFRPTAIIHYDNTLEVDAIPDTDYFINLEVYRLPMRELEQCEDEPEINAKHHRHLVKWVLHRAYQTQDGETENPVRSEKFLKQFEEYFGDRPTADLRKKQNSNRPHHTKAW